MTKRRVGPEPRLVWRISESAPKGEWVDPGVVDRDISAAAKEVASGSSWASSSFDLLHGVDVKEDDPTTIPAELYDELFDPPLQAQPSHQPDRKKS